MSVMEVTFTKLQGRRYLMTVVRERGPELAPRQGPGYNDYLPHDAVHFIVEAEAALSGGVFGRVAAGQNNIFTTADPTVRRHQARREAKRRPQATDRADMARSEELASLCQPLWELRAGLRSELPLGTSRIEPDLFASPLVERIVRRLSVCKRIKFTFDPRPVMLMVWRFPWMPRSRWRPSSPRCSRTWTSGSGGW